MSKQRGWITGVLGAGLALTACANSEEVPADGKIPSPDDLRGSVSAGLRRANSCEDLLTQIQNDSIAKLDLAIDLYKDNEDRLGGPGGGPVPSPGIPQGPGRGEGDWDTDDDWGGGAQDAGVGLPAPPVAEDPSDAPTPEPVPDGMTSDPAVGGDGNFDPGTEQPVEEGPSGFSGTNNQVAEVDEADFVKIANDGNHMYMLHGSHLFGLDAWPAAEMSMFGSPAQIEGYPSEMFVHDGKAVVFSSIEDYDGTRFESKPDQRYRWRPFTKVTVLDLSSETPTTIRELYYEGSYTSSRRYDDIARIVLAGQSEHGGLFYPEVERYDAWGREYPEDVLEAQLQEWRSRTAASIRNTELSDWLPDTYEKVDGAVVKIEPTCDTYYTPVAGLAEWGLTRIVAVDMSAPDANIAGNTIVGATSIVYSNTDTMVLGQPDFRSSDVSFGIADSEQTALHVMAINGAETDYVTSGWVPGHPVNQFALEARPDAVFISTTGWERVNKDTEPFEDGWWETRPVNQLLALKRSDDGLNIASTTGHFGHEGETTRSTRFVGDRAYAVTFLNTDPLYVIDTSNPDDLKVLGEVEIPGFSQYMHPLDDDHLLTIGQNAGWGVQLQIFDVSDDMNPKQTHVYDYGDAHSEAQWNHKAFNYYAEFGLLAVPVSTWSQGYRSGLDVLRVSAENGFSPLGMAEHTEFAQTYCEQWEDGFGEVYEECWVDHTAEVRRGMFINDEEDVYVYAIGYGGVTVSNVNDMANTLASVELPPQQYNDGDYYGDGGDRADGGWVDGGTTTGGSAGSGGAPPAPPVSEPAPTPAPEPDPGEEPAPDDSTDEDTAGEEDPDQP